MLQGSESLTLSKAFVISTNTRRVSKLKFLNFSIINLNIKIASVHNLPFLKLYEPQKLGEKKYLRDIHEFVIVIVMSNKYCATVFMKSFTKL